MQHFHFSHLFPGQVKVKNDCDGSERTIDLHTVGVKKRNVV